MKTILVLVVIQLSIFAWLQYRNNCPEAFDDEVSVFEGHSVKIQPLRNDTDEDKDEISIEEVVKPLHGKITQDKNVLTYYIEKGFVGVDSFAYTINDGDKISDEAYIKVTVNENKQPVANKDYVQFYRGNDWEINVLGNDADNEGDSIFIAEFTQPSNGQLTRTSSGFIYKTIDNLAKKDSFQYIISDGFSNSEKAMVVIDIKEKTDPLYPWLFADVGNPALKGSVGKKGNKINLGASGSDIWGNSDNFGYAWQIANGDCEIITRIEHIDNTNEWSKAGIMIRETLDAGSKYALVAITGAHGLTFQRRLRARDGSRGDGHDGIAAPYWLKLTRKGNVFTSSISPDGRKWTETANDSIPMNDNVFIGLAVTSHDDSKIGNVSFSSCSVKR